MELKLEVVHQLKYLLILINIPKGLFYKSEVTRTPTDDFGDRHTNQLILHSFPLF
jgi:hypothetical protein